MNSTELRHIVAEGGVFPRAGGQQGEFTLERKEEAGAQDWCDLGSPPSGFWGFVRKSSYFA